MKFLKNKTSVLFILLQFIILSTANYSCSDNKRFETTKEYSSLISLFKKFREFQLPPIIDCVPDYSKNTMTLQYKGLKNFQEELF